VIAALVVILAVINFVNMSTARATIRAKEIGIRKVTGALRSNIVRQFIGESFVIVLIAFVLAALTTQLSLPFFSQILNVEITTGIFNGSVPVYLFALLVIVAIIAGVYPAFVMSSFQPILVLKNEISGTHGSKRLRKMLLIVQLSISLGILSFSGVLFLQLKYMSEKDMGIDHENIIHVEPTYRMVQKFDAFRNELAKSGVIIQAAASNGNPIDLQSQNTGVSWPGKPVDERVSFQVTGCSQEFLETFNLKLLNGRNFLTEPQDSINTEVIVTEDAVDVMGLKDPIGTVIKIGDASCVIIGVVNNFHTRPLHEERLPVILYRHQYVHCSFVFVKYHPGKTEEALAAIKNAYNTVEPSFTMKYWFQDERFDKQYKTENIASTLILFFSTIALVIACIGIVGLATFNVLRRLKEMSIRKVFGASGVQLLSLLTKEFGWILLSSFVIGTSLVWYASDKWLSGFAYHVSMPWWLFLICTVVLTVLTIGIVVTLGMRAIVSNPTTILRND
jgi:putative ABC transport system permease protein